MYDYPENFPELETKIGAIKLDRNDFEQLEASQNSAIWLRDNIINSFFLILKEIGSEKNINMFVKIQC